MTDKLKNVPTVVTLQTHLALHSQLLLAKRQQEAQWTIILNMLRIQKEKEIDQKVEPTQILVEQMTKNKTRDQARCKRFTYHKYLKIWFK